MLSGELKQTLYLLCDLKRKYCQRAQSCTESAKPQQHCLPVCVCGLACLSLETMYRLQSSTKQRGWNFVRRIRKYLKPTETRIKQRTCVWKVYCNKRQGRKFLKTKKQLRRKIVFLVSSQPIISQLSFPIQSPKSLCIVKLRRDKLQIEQIYFATFVKIVSFLLDNVPKRLLLNEESTILDHFCYENSIFCCIKQHREYILHSQFSLTLHPSP